MLQKHKSILVFIINTRVFIIKKKKNNLVCTFRYKKYVKILYKLLKIYIFQINLT